MLNEDNDNMGIGFYSIIRTDKSYFESETGKILNEAGMLLGYMELTDNEELIVCRDEHGLFSEIMKSGSKYISKDDIIYEVDVPYKDWKYYETE